MGRVEGNGGLSLVCVHMCPFLHHHSIPLVEKGYHFLKMCINVQAMVILHYIYEIGMNFVSKEPNYYYNQSINVLLMQQSQNSFDKMKKSSA